MTWFLNLVGHLPDVVILLSGGALTAALALVLAAIGRRTLFLPGDARLQEHGKLADLVHGSVLAFTVFTLALVLADVRGNLGQTVDATLREASTITRLDAELELAAGAEARAAREDLRAYAATLVSSEWPSLGAFPPSLSDESADALRALKAAVRATAAAEPAIATEILRLKVQLEEMRLGRLENATKTIPHVFWWIIFAFLLTAMVMNGRYPLDWASGALISLHMAALGLVLALILVLDEPFRGETSVSPTPIAQALDR